jgi:propanol-preferring alcohol dehydrogenase
VEVPDPVPAAGQILVRVSACGVCHTERDEIEGRTPPVSFPFILGHQVVGTVVGHGPGAGKHAAGRRVGIGWIGASCGECRFCCVRQRKSLSDFRSTGRDLAGGYAQYLTVSEKISPIRTGHFFPTRKLRRFCARAPTAWRSLQSCQPSWRRTAGG